MSAFLRFCIIISVVEFFVLSTKGDCNVCQTGKNIACITDTKYQQCLDNKPFGYIFECDPGQYCSLEGKCSSEEALAECRDCRKCDETKTFACLNTKEFSLCLGTTNTSEINGLCTGNLVCNVNYKEICVENAPTCSSLDVPTTTTTSTSSTTSTTTTTTTTTPSPLTKPVEFCTAIGHEGRYPVGNDPITTCHQYVNCRNINGKWYGPIYNCPGSTYYDSAKSSCVAELPPLCSAAVSTLSFRNILLE